MSCLCWNVCGLRSQCIVHELALLVRAQDPSVVFLAETWANEDRLSKLCDDLQFDEKWIVQRVTRSRGLALLWKNSLVIYVDWSSLNYINAIINKGKEDPWSFIRIYGVLEASINSKTWDLL